MRWDESLHPRDPLGRFSNGGGGRGKPRLRALNAAERARVDAAHDRATVVATRRLPHSALGGKRPDRAVGTAIPATRATSAADTSPGARLRILAAPDDAGDVDDRDTELVLTDARPDGRGGWDVDAVVLPRVDRPETGEDARRAAAVAQLRANIHAATLEIGDPEQLDYADPDDWEPDRAEDEGPGPTWMGRVEAIRRTCAQVGAELQQRVHDRLSGADVQHGDADLQRARVQREEVLALLAELRPMGPDGDARVQYRVDDGHPPEAGAAIEWAQQHFPTDWLTEMYDDGLLRVRVTRRGYLEGDIIAVSDSHAGPHAIPGSGRWGETGVHELTHLAEARVPGLVATQEAYLWHRTTDAGTVSPNRSRTGSNRLQELPRHPGELGRPDGFPEPYASKSNGNSHELLTITAQGLFGGGRGATGKYYDDDMRDFLLGAWVLL